MADVNLLEYFNIERGHFSTAGGLTGSEFNGTSFLTASIVVSQSKAYRVVFAGSLKYESGIHDRDNVIGVKVNGELKNIGQPASGSLIPGTSISADTKFVLSSSNNEFIYSASDAPVQETSSTIFPFPTGSSLGETLQNLADAINNSPGKFIVSASFFSPETLELTASFNGTKGNLIEFSGSLLQGGTDLFLHSCRPIRNAVETFHPQGSRPTNLHTSWRPFHIESVVDLEAGDVLEVFGTGSDIFEISVVSSSLMIEVAASGLKEGLWSESVALGEYIERDGDVQITGNLDITGILTAQEYHTEVVSASILFESGSSLFGNSLDDIHQFTGSIFQTGSGATSHFVDKVGIGTRVVGGANQIQVQGTASFVHIISEENVGIGTSTPSTDLHVHDTIPGQSPTIRIQCSGSILDLVAGGSDRVFVKSSDSDDIVFQTNDVDRIVIKGNFGGADKGNVGIGSAEPDALLQVTGTTHFGTDCTDKHEFTGSVEISCSLAVEGLVDIIGDLDVEGEVQITGSLIASSSAGHQVFGPLEVNNPFNQFLINSSGFVGIGSEPVSPLAELHVFGETIFGEVLGNKHQFTGSVCITGSLLVNGSLLDLSNLEATASDHEARLILEEASSSDFEGRIVNEEASSSDFEGRIVNEEATSSDHEARIVLVEATSSEVEGEIDDIHSSGSAGLGLWTASVGGVEIDADVEIIGQLTASSLEVAGLKNFAIPHPTNNDMKLYHSCVESPTAGDNMYTYRIEAKTDNEIVTVNLPGYWSHINKNPRIWIQPIGMFSQAYGWTSDDMNKVHIKCQYAGKYEVLLLGTRDDEIAKQSWTGPERWRM